MKLPTKILEHYLLNRGYKKIIAVDEVGMGSLAGPVVVCALEFNKNFFREKHKNLRRLRDSKSLSVSQREKFVHELIKEKNFKYHIGYCFPKTIDRINIYQSARLAMKRAIAKFKIHDSIVLVDGKNKIKGLNLEQMPIIKGDRKVFSIACASLLAKVWRDKMMRRYAKKFPHYEFDRHKGYGTKLHRAMLLRHGSSPIHRKSFRLLV